jgi:signal transduction histidine kinase
MARDDRSEHSTFRAFTAWQTTFATALVLAVTGCAFALIERVEERGTLEWMYLVHAGIAAIVALLLWRRPNATERWSLIAILALALPLVPISWLAQKESVAEGTLWQPFIGRKLIILGVALLTPYSRGATIALLAVFMAEWLHIWDHLELGNNAVATAAGEPWVTLLYFIAAASLAVLRWRNRRLEDARRKAEAEAEALNQLRRVSVAVSDRANTPLQTLGVGLALLGSHHPEEERILERMSRSLRALTKLTESLRKMELKGLRATQTEGARLEKAVETPC